MRSRLFSLDHPVDRRFYVASGLGLMLLKYAVDAVLVRIFAGKLWTPLDYLSPALSLRSEALDGGPPWLLYVMAAVSLPFLWLGTSLTMRRAVDAGYSAWLALLFFVPVVNYLAMLYLALAPSAVRPSSAARAPSSGMDSTAKSALLGIALAVPITLAMMALAVFGLGYYGSGLFIGTPFIIGATSGYVFNQHTPRSAGKSVAVALAAITMSAGSLVLFMLEGVVCLVMAFPLAAVAAALGALAGRAIALGPVGGRGHAVLVLGMLPFLVGAESLSGPAPIREVLSTLEVEAPREVVFENVLGFSELPPPNELVFRLGIAFPQRARIEGHGVGAVRYCEFSTGPFVEPITAWEAPARLAFDVRAQPPPMTEWSPYRHVFAPHLDGYLESRRGEFLLVRLPNNRTRIEARTWYALSIQPLAYWGVLADALIGAIHQRVLEHVKALSEPQSLR